MTEIAAIALVPGQAYGEVLVLDEPLSFWGGLDPARGVIVGRHLQAGILVTGRILVMKEARGSSSSAAILAEAIRLGTAPAAIVMETPDDVITAGAVVAEELYARTCPVLRVDSIVGLRNGVMVRVEGDTLRM